MRVELGVSQTSLRRWQVELARRLAGVPGTSVGIRWSRSVGDPLPTCATALLGLERALHGTGTNLTATAEPTDLSPYVGMGGTHADLVIDLGGGSPPSGQRRWRLIFDGMPGDVPIVAALLEGRAPLIAIIDCLSGDVIGNARPGIPDTSTIVAGFEAVTARAINLVLAAVKGSRSPLRSRPERSLLSCSDAMTRATQSLTRAALARLSVTAKKPIHARTGWRFVTGPDVVDLGAHPATGWQVLPDDGGRCYSHPFPIVTRSESWLFVTERNFILNKSLISAVRFGHHGPLAAPAPVFELPDDLSYPHVFEADGNIWMIPGRGDRSSIDLYRASRFPGGWRHEACLIPDIDASAATPFRHGGRWWMTAAVRDGGFDADMLHLWSASDLRGPWRAHPANPVLIDAATVESAGRVVERAGRLIRPVRSVRNDRSSLQLAEIIRLDDESFEQRVVSEIPVGPIWPGRGVSTLNRAGSIECIDGGDFSISKTRSAGATSRRKALEVIAPPQSVAGAA